MALILSDNATNCGANGRDIVAFQDSRGEYTYVPREELDKENMEIFYNPEALTVLQESIDDFLDGRFVDFDL